jgi:hypothetical protein
VRIEGARCAAEQLVQRHVRHLAGQVPEGDIHGADGAHLGARPAAERHRLQHIRPQPVDLRRIAPQQHGRKRTVHHGFLGFRVRIRFAQAHQAAIGVDADPQPLDGTGNARVMPRRRWIVSTAVMRIQ